jgi:uncharacterized membrane protein
MPKLTYAENPVHPAVNDYPAALVPASLVFDMLHLVTRRGSFKVASFFTLLMGLITGGVAAFTGFMDYREIRAGTEAKRIANAHALLNAGVLVSLVIQVLMRVTGRVGFGVRILNIGTNVALMSSSWYGSHLVYRHGLRVRGVDPIAAAPGGGRDLGKPLAERLERLAARIPAADYTGAVTQALGLAGGRTGKQAGATSSAPGFEDRAAGPATGAASVSMTSSGGSTRASEHVDAGSFEADTDDQGALGTPFAEGDVDVAATVRESLPDEIGR